MAKMMKQWFKDGERGWKLTFYSSQLIAIVLILVSFFIPPTGIIDSSIFAGIGELAFFPTLYAFYMIMRSGRQATITKGETTLSVAGETKE